MRKALLILVLAACAALTASASGSDLQLGVSALYSRSLQTIDAGDAFEPSLVSPGLEARLRFLQVLQVGGGATLWRPFVENSESTTILASCDAGLCLDLFLMRFGAGIGPTIVFESYDGESDTESLWNIKLYGEIQLGKVSIGASALYLFEQGYGIGDAFGDMGDWIDDPYLSATLLFKL